MKNYSAFKISFSSLSLSLVLFSCAHYPDVRPGANGVHSVIVKADDVNEGSRNALSQASDYCETKKKEAVIVSENSKYSGSMDEGSYKTAKKISKAAKTIGPAVWGVGGKTESSAGGTVGVACAAGDEFLGDEYSVEMKFSCQ